MRKLFQKKSNQQSNKTILDDEAIITLIFESILNRKPDQNTINENIPHLKLNPSLHIKNLISGLLVEYTPIDEELDALLDEHTKYDQILYEYAKTIFERQCKSMLGDAEVVA